MRLTIAIASDLHIGRGARAKDLCPYADSPALETDYRSRFGGFVKREKIRADFLLVPGDISNKAQPDEFALASTVVTELAQTLSVKRSNILFVPGNHDVDWDAMSGHADDKSGVRRAQRYVPLGHRDWIFSRIMRRGRQTLLAPPWFAVWEFEDLIAVGYNSAFHDDPFHMVHHGLASREALGRLEEVLTTYDFSAKRLRLFLVHHHPIQYSDPIEGDPDFSVMVNADLLMALLRKHHFDLVVHGHKHKPNVSDVRIDSGFPLVIVGAGSFSAELDTRWSGHVNNQFHIVTIEGRDNETGSVYGIVRSWSYLCGRGWGPSHESNGIRHVTPFGAEFLPTELSRLLQPIVDRCLVEKRYAEWDELVGHVPRLAYLPPMLVTHVLDALAQTMGFRRVGNPPDKCVLFR